jgi:hypothetical protein
MTVRATGLTNFTDQSSLYYPAQDFPLIAIQGATVKPTVSMRNVAQEKP